MYFLRTSAIDIFIALSIILLTYAGFHHLLRVSRGGMAFNYKISEKRRKMILILLALGGILIALGSLGPVFQSLPLSISGNADILFAVDLSKSMDARDSNIGGPLVSRLESAKYLISDYMGRHENHSYALVGFAGEAVNIIPMTEYSDAIAQVLPSLSTETVRKQGTDISSIFKVLDPEAYKKRPLNVVILSDGEDLASEGIGAEIRKHVGEERLRIFTVGIGSADGAGIPVGNDFFGGTIYKKYQDEKVVTKLDEKSLRSLSDLGDGAYSRATSKNTISKTIDDRLLISESSSDLQQRRSRDEGQLLASLGFLLIGSAYLLPYRSFLGKRS